MVRREVPWRLVIYVDQVLSGSRSIRRSLEGLAAQAGRLTDLGTVEVVQANPDPVVTLRPTRSASLVEQTLTRLARETPGRDELRQVRKWYANMMQTKGEIDGLGIGFVSALPAAVAGPRAGGLGRGAPGGEQNNTVTRLDNAMLGFNRMDVIRLSLQQENSILRRQHDALLSWAGAPSEGGPRSLLLINDGWDLDPLPFYSSGTPLAGNLVSLIAAVSDSHGAETRSEMLARSLSARGWVSVSIAYGTLDAGGTWSAEHTGRGRVGDLVVGDSQTLADFPAGYVVSPLGPLNKMAAYTGGETLRGPERLPAALQRLRDKVRVTYQVARRADGALHRIEVRSRRPGLKVRAPRWSGSALPEEAAASRSRRLLTGGGDGAACRCSRRWPSSRARPATRERGRVGSRPGSTCAPWRRR